MSVKSYKTKDGKTKWLAYFRYTDWQGHTVAKKKEGFALKREAQEYEREFLLKENRRCDMTFASLVELYRTDATHRTRDTTQGTSDSIIDKWILPFFGSLQVDKIDAVTVRKWQNELMGATNPRSGRPYAQTYLRTIHSRLSAIFNYAVTYYKLPQNPCAPAGAIGKKKAGRMKFWTLAEFEAALAQVKKPAYRLALQLLYWLGIRVGEALAATPADFLPSCVFRIEKTYHRKAGEDTAGPPKTENGYRELTMPRFLYDEVMDYVGRLYGMGAHDRIFYFTHGTLNNELDRAAAAAGVKRIRIHDLRHSHAALLVELGYSIPAIAERLGDSVKTTMETYIHLYPQQHVSVAADLEAAAAAPASLDGLGDKLQEAEKRAVFE